MFGLGWGDVGGDGSGDPGVEEEEWEGDEGEADVKGD